MTKKVNKKVKINAVIILLIAAFFLGTLATRLVGAVSDKIKWKDAVGDFWKPADSTETTVSDSIVNKNDGLTIVKRLTVPYLDPAEVAGKGCTVDNLGEVAVFPGNGSDRDRVKVCVKESSSGGYNPTWLEITN